MLCDISCLEISDKRKQVMVSTEKVDDTCISTNTHVTSKLITVSV